MLFIKNKRIILSLLFFCYVCYAFAQESRKENKDFGIEANFVSNDFQFKHISIEKINPLIRFFAGNSRFYGGDGYGFGFYKKINTKARIEISPSFYNIHILNNYSYYLSNGSNIATREGFNMKGFIIPVSYISYFKIPKHKISTYFIGGFQYYNFNLLKFSSNYQDSMLTSKEENHYHANGIGIMAGIGLDYKIKKWLYLFYNVEYGVSLIDGGFFGDVRIGAGFNFFKKK